MSAPKFGQFADLLEIASEPLRPVVQRLRDLILDVDPATHEVVRLGERAASYGCGPRKMVEGYAYIMPFKSWVNLGFFQGASLSDPRGLLEGKGVRLRHVKVRSVGAAENPALRDLIVEAHAERKAALG